MGKARYTLWEYGGNAKASSVDVRTADLTAGNIVAQTGLFDDFRAAIDDVVIGNPGTVEFVATVDEVAKNPSTNELAQRENKWLVSFIDTTTNRGGSYTIPTALLTGLLDASGEFMDTASAEYIALKAASDAFVKSVAGNATEVQSVKFVAR